MKETKIEMQAISVDRLDVVLYPHPALRVQCDPIKEVDMKVDMVIDKMLHIMNRNRAIGLSAPQVGLPWQLFVYNATPDNLSNNTVVINPEIQDLEDLEFHHEGCLSIPGVIVNVRRSQKCVLKAIGKDEKEFSRIANGLEARIIQHEIDHLNGKLMIDYQSVSEEISNKKHLKYLKKKFKVKNNFNAHP